jgi:cysteine desulfurase
VGLGAACEVARADLERESARQERLRDQLAALLQAAVPGLAITAGGVPRLPNTLHVRFPSPSAGHRILARTPEIAASTGSACHEPAGPAHAPGIDRPSQVLLAMGVAPADAVGAVRLSLGRGTTEADVVAAAAALARAWSGEHGHR